MHAALNALLLSLPLTALAGVHEGSLRRRHSDLARSASYARRGAVYTLEDKYQGPSFFDGFNFETGSDPTGGLVNYVAQDVATGAAQLAYVQSDNTTIVAVDSTSAVAVGGLRNSVRLTSKKTYNSGLFIADFFAMPHGCGLWPAYWTVNGESWPNGGELDVIENVNLATNNQITLHTGGACSPGTVNTTSNLVNPTCQSTPDADTGCAYLQNDPTTFGHNFNEQAGGVFAHLWNSDGITVWWFPRATIPQDIQSGNPNPSSWGEPAAAFPNSASCDIAAEVYNHNIVLDTTICGDWAGPAYPSGQCPGTCAEIVANATNFKYAKWEINYISVYQQQ